MARPTKYKREYCKAVVEHMRDGASLTSFAAELEVARSTINEWIDNHPEFSESVKIGKAHCAAWWERVSRANAVEGGGNATLVIFGLKNMSPDDWKDRREIDNTSSDGSMTPRQTINTVDAKEAASQYQKIMRGDG